jgi:hypothetical protein
VTCCQALEPLPLKVRSTTHWVPVCVSRFDAAELTWVPSTAAGASRYFVAPSVEQAMM